jgi:hypothetical protein
MGAWCGLSGFAQLMATLVLDFSAEITTGDNADTIRRVQHVWNEVWRAGSVAALTTIALVAVAAPASAAPPQPEVKASPLTQPGAHMTPTGRARASSGEDLVSSSGQAGQPNQRLASASQHLTQRLGHQRHGVWGHVALSGDADAHGATSQVVGTRPRYEYDPLSHVDLRRSGCRLQRPSERPVRGV